MKYLSIYEDYYECVEFLSKYDFLPVNFKEENGDLLAIFEGDPDVLYMEDSSEPVFFGAFHPDYSIDGEQVVLTTASWKDETAAIKSFFEDIGDWIRKTCDEFEKSAKTRIMYRGGIGCYYSLFERA